MAIFERQTLGDRFNFYSSTQIGAPQMNGANGSEGQLLQVLDACLVDGFNQQTVSSVMVNGDLVTLKFGTSTGFMPRQLLSISGADDANLNGDARIVSVSGNDVVVKKPGVTVLTGTIKAKVAPLNFESIFGRADTKRRAYRSKNMQGTRTVLFLDMNLPTNHGYHATSPAKRAMVTLCQDMTEIGVPINDYTALVNDKAKAPNGCLFWYQKRGYNKTDAVTSTKNNQWVLAGNGDYFLLFSGCATSSVFDGLNYRDMVGFGDCVSLAGSYDRYNCFLFAAHSPNDTKNMNFMQGGRLSYYTTTVDTITSNPLSYQYAGLLVKDYNGLADVVWFTPSSSSSSSGSSEYTGYYNVSYPNPANQSLIVKPVEVMQINQTLRGVIPRLLFIANKIDNEIDLIQHETVFPIKVQRSDTSNTAYISYYGFDIGD